MQNLEFVNLKCVTYTQPIPLPLSYMKMIQIMQIIMLLRCL